MQRGNFWRVGKTTLFRTTKDKTSESGYKIYSGLSSRTSKEDADRIWLLGIYETNTEAALAEEEFSLKFHAPKACFVARGHKRTLYRWATQEQLDRHHEKNKPCLYHIANELDNLGFSIDFPIWDREKDKNYPLGSQGRLIEMRACNLVSGYMEVSTTSGPEMKRRQKGGRIPNSVPFTIERRPYCGYVFSLDVEKNHNYLANNIVTHNCLSEVSLIKSFVLEYMEDYQVDPDNFTELGYCNELAEIEIYLIRLNHNLAKPENAELIVDQPMGVDRNGNPITQKQVSPFFDMKEKLLARKQRIVKLMVGDRQERYKREAALKQKDDTDTSSKQAEMRRRIDTLQRKLESIEAEEKPKQLTEPKVLTPDALLSSTNEEI